MTTVEQAIRIQQQCTENLSQFDENKMFTAHEVGTSYLTALKNAAMIVNEQAAMIEELRSLLKSMDSHLDGNDEIANDDYHHQQIYKILAATDPATREI